MLRLVWCSVVIWLRLYDVSIYSACFSHYCRFLEKFIFPFRTSVNMIFQRVWANLAQTKKLLLKLCIETVLTYTSSTLEIWYSFLRHWRHLMFRVWHAWPKFCLSCHLKFALCSICHVVGASPTWSTILLPTILLLISNENDIWALCSVTVHQVSSVCGEFNEHYVSMYFKRLIVQLM